MGRRREPLRFVCRACGAERETWNIGNKGVYCSKACRADFERKSRDAAGRYKTPAGYWMLRWIEDGGYRFQFEHRRVWENANGPVPAGFVVHHINGDKSDNRLENLRLMRDGSHKSLHQRGVPKRRRVAA